MFYDVLKNWKISFYYYKNLKIKTALWAALECSSIRQTWGQFNSRIGIDGQFQYWNCLFKNKWN